MDPSQKAAEPLKPASNSDFAVSLNRGITPTSTEAEKRNREHAGEELSAIWHLRDNKQFQWFWRECIEKQLREAKDAYHDEQLSPESANTFRTKYLALRRVARWLLDREIEHRRLINPHDTEIARLREKISLL